MTTPRVMPRARHGLPPPLPPPRLRLHASPSPSPSADRSRSRGRSHRRHTNHKSLTTATATATTTKTDAHSVCKVQQQTYADRAVFTRTQRDTTRKEGVTVTMGAARTVVMVIVMLMLMVIVMVIVVVVVVVVVVEVEVRGRGRRTATADSTAHMLVVVVVLLRTRVPQRAAPPTARRSPVMAEAATCPRLGTIDMSEEEGEGTTSERAQQVGMLGQQPRQRKRGALLELGATAPRLYARLQ